MEQDDVFLSNFKGSAAANIITGIFVTILYILKNKCKHSQCKVNNRCFTCSIKEDDDEEDLERGQRRRRKRRESSSETEESVREVFKGKCDGIHEKHQKAIPTD